MVLAKKTNQSPVKLAESIKQIIEKNLEDFSTIEIAGPGFINLRFTPELYQELILKILKSNLNGIYNVIDAITVC